MPVCAAAPALLDLDDDELAVPRSSKVKRTRLPRQHLWYDVFAGKTNSIVMAGH